MYPLVALSVYPLVGIQCILLQPLLQSGVERDADRTLGPARGSGPAARAHSRRANLKRSKLFLPPGFLPPATGER
ncbi:hypothetical protein chiPu_0005780 [Chiloscyllium punctatum]|uniref:Uncharacterized protein n=1 Tax=Chiloscyllium punctatum TaxID=137246 RepID=A0A401SAF5_CHIPU|nr:hypothetical protein [Chiloscyllium punctatum]